MKTFSGTVAASIAQSGAGTAKNKKPIGKANTRSIGQPAETSTQPMITGIQEKTSAGRTPCVLPKNIKRRPVDKDVHPKTGAGKIIVLLIFSRDCQTSQSAAAIINGPWPSCSVCQGPSIKLSTVGVYATRNDPTSNAGQSHP